MAAYGALVSVMQIMDQLHRHPHPPISLDKNQSESLAANVTFLQEFLEGYNPNVSYTAEADPLESRIAEAAYAVKDVIESYIVDRILAQSTDHGENISSIEFYQDLQKVLEYMGLIKMETEKMMKEKKMGLQIIKTSTTGAGSFRSSSTAQKVNTMVGFDDVLYEMLEKIVGGGAHRQIIPIVGMGGLGKTTLALNIYANQLVKEHFHVCAWSTISQLHNTRKILHEILGQVGQHYGGDLSEYELGEKLYRYLIGRRYFIVMDDMWNIKAWDVVRMFFPDNENGSRIVVTTRLSNLASHFNYSNGLDMKFLDETSSWNLFSKIVFGEEICPLELKDIGKKIVEGCRGLPLSIVVIGGLLSKSEATRENWEVIEENLNSIVNSEDNGNCLQTLYMSYNSLPVYIKPCFLYLGILYYEDAMIQVFLLIQVWVAMGIIKAFEGKSLEDVAEDCIEELADRNLILVEERDYCGKVMSFKMHDLLRDLSLKEAGKDKYSLCALKQRSTDTRETSQGIISTQSGIATTFDKEYPLLISLLESDEPAESPLVCTLRGKFPKNLSIPSIRLLMAFMLDSYDDKEICTQLVCFPILFVDSDDGPLSRIPSTFFFWNLQTLCLDNTDDNYSLDIWTMPRLRHVMTYHEGTLCLPNPPPLSGDDIDDLVVMENLQTLFIVYNLNLGEEVLKRIPNINTLKLEYYCDGRGEELGDYCLHNLHGLHKLQDLCLSNCSSSTSSQFKRQLCLPYSLKKLTLLNTRLPWEDMSTKIGCLPLLLVLQLQAGAFTGSEWETVEGQFSSLKFLLIEKCDLEYWITDDAHFPCLEHLLLHRLKKLREIPSSIGDIPTLRSIELEGCRDSVEDSAQRILEEQEEYGNEDFQVMWRSLSSDDEE